jgi:hypothetical protein
VINTVVIVGVKISRVITSRIIALIIPVVVSMVSPPMMVIWIISVTKMMIIPRVIIPRIPEIISVIDTHTAVVWIGGIPK